MKLISKLCAVDVIRCIGNEVCTTGILERTRNHEIESDLNYNERSSLIPDYLTLASYSAKERVIDLHCNLIAIGWIKRWKLANSAI